MIASAHDQVYFARRAVAAIQKIVAMTKVMQGKRLRNKKFLSNLEAALHLTASRLGKLKAEDVTCLDRVRKLLIMLEQMTKFPSSFLAPSEPDDLDHYHTLRIIVQGQSAQKWLLKLSRAEHGKAQCHFLDSLSRSLTSKGPRDPIELDIDSNKTSMQQWDCQAYIEHLYGILSPLCLCFREEKEERITANLQLRRCYFPNEPLNAMEFRLFFLDHPHRDDHLRPPQWQDVSICIPKKTDGFEGRQRPTSSIEVEGSPVSADTFCGVVTKRVQSQLQLAVLRDGLVVLQQDQPCAGAFNLLKPSISLADLLKSSHSQLRIPHKIILSYIMARSFWQLYDSDWMQRPWTKKDVHFMMESRFSSSREICISDPFLSTQFGCHDEVLHPSVHPFPKLLALGIMFLEIGLGQGLENFRRPENLDQSGRPNANTDFYTAQRVFEETKDVDGYIYCFGKLIKRCIDHTYFFKYRNDIGGLREAFQNDIVDVLYTSYEELDKGPDVERAGSISLPAAIVNVCQPSDRSHCSSAPPSSNLSNDFMPQDNKYHSTTNSARSVSTREIQWGLNSQSQQRRVASQPSLNLNNSEFSPPSHSVNETFSRDNVTSGDWFERFEILGRVLRNPRNQAWSGVRITILDTGVSHDFNGKVKGYEDFMSHTNTAYQDLTGHGTEAVSLITTVYPAAEIYVGRVFERSYADENTANLIAKAISHAVVHWKTDIIVLASGFEKSCTKLEDKIKAASDAGTLIFAAASNYGNVTDIAFPARLYKDSMLFCMFATTASIRATCGFNPSPRDGAEYNFAILGENVEIPFTNKIKSGTSYSTMIGAGLAGLILDFVRHETAKGRERYLKKLSTIGGMSAVFATMARDRDNGYNCIAPWKILSEHVRNERADKDVARKDVLDKIIAALQDRYGSSALA